MHHDNSYRALFAHPEMVADLLREYVREDWVGQLDFSTLEKVPSHFVAEKHHRRESDVIWRVRFRGDWLYVYILLEFQSRIDRFMALRLLGYVGLLYQDLVSRRRLTVNGMLPPVVPLVLYNGRRRWKAPLDLGRLIQQLPDPALNRFQPALSYLLLDEGCYAGHRLPEARNFAAAVFNLENSDSAHDMQQVIIALKDWLDAPGQESLRRAFNTWIKAVLIPAKLPGVELQVDDVFEDPTMLAERVKEWTQEWMDKGRQAGRQEGEVLLLRRQLARRFGPLPTWVERRLEAADTQALETWADRVLDAATLEAVFE